MSVFLSFILGLVFGSFLNVLIWRLPKGMTILGRSVCPKCKKQIAWYDNIPLFSFFLLRGKCRNCHKAISRQYPLVEAITGIGFVLIGWNFPWLVLFCLLLAIFVIDLQHQIIPDELVFAGIIVALPFCRSSDLLAGFIAASFLLLIHLITRGRGMGLGDVKLAVFGGMVVGLELVFNWLVLSFLTGAVVGVILVLVKKAKLKSQIAFGPFLILALFLTVIIWGRIGVTHS